MIVSFVGNTPKLRILFLLQQQQNGTSDDDSQTKRRSMDQLTGLFNDLEKSSRQRSLSDGDGGNENGKLTVLPVPIQFLGVDRTRFSPQIPSRIF